jgi:hypothetical protein
MMRILRQLPDRDFVPVACVDLYLGLDARIEWLRSVVALRLVLNAGLNQPPWDEKGGKERPNLPLQASWVVDCDAKGVEGTPRKGARALRNAHIIRRVGRVQVDATVRTL